MTTPRQELAANLASLIREKLRETGRYHLPGFGVWTLKYRKARRIKDRSGNWLDLPETPEVKFRACKQLRETVARQNRFKGPQPGLGRTNEAQTDE